MHRILWGGRRSRPPLGRRFPPQGGQPRFLTRPSRPLEGCFSTKQGQQGAHGHSSGHSVMHLVRRGDARAADTFLMIKGGDSVVVPALRTTRLSSLVQEGKLALRAEETSTAGPPTISCAGRLSVRADGGFSAPTVVSTIMERVHGHPSYGGLGYISFVAFPTATRKRGPSPP